MNRPDHCDIDAIFARTEAWAQARLVKDIAAGVTLDSLKAEAKIAIARGDRRAYNRACLRYRALERAASV